MNNVQEYRDFWNKSYPTPDFRDYSLSAVEFRFNTAADDNTGSLPKRIRGSRSEGLNDHEVAAGVPENFVVTGKPVDLANVNVAEVSTAEVFNDVELLPGEV